MSEPDDDDAIPTLPTWVTGAGAHSVPEQIGPFTVLEKIGAGGAGEVWAAHEQTLDRRVALKLVRRSGVAHEQETRLLREAHALAKLSHPHVVTVHDADHTDDYVYIAMELVEGGTLKTAFADPANGPAQRMEWLLQAGRGLQAAHDLGLVHRDFKPANALLGRDGRVRVADFGLARLADPSARPDSAPTPSAGLESTFSELTITGAILGTPAYMSPEQRLGQRIDAASDQFSFCVVAWQALFGVNPLAEVNLAQWVAGEATLPPAPSVAGVPAAIATTLRRGLHPSPTGRHPSMAPILRVLESATRPRSRWRRVAVLGAVAAAALVVAGLTRWEPGQPHVARPGSPRIANVLLAAAEPKATEFTADQLQRRGAALAELGDAAGAVETLRVAYNLAERTGQGPLASRIAAQLAVLTAVDLQQPDRGRVWLESAEAFAPLPDEVTARVSFARGQLAAQAGRWAEAAEAFERSAALQVDADPESDGPAEAWMRQAEARAKLGDPQQALRSVSLAVQRRKRVYGPQHPTTQAALRLEASLQSR